MHATTRFTPASVGTAVPRATQTCFLPLRLLTATPRSLRALHTWTMQSRCCSGRQAQRCRITSQSARRKRVSGCVRLRCLHHQRRSDTARLSLVRLRPCCLGNTSKNCLEDTSVREMAR